MTNCCYCVPRPDSGICGKAQHNAVVRRASADRNRWSVRWLLHMSHGLIVCGLTLRALCQPNPEHYDPRYMELWKLAKTQKEVQASTELVVTCLRAAATLAEPLWSHMPHRGSDWGAYASVKLGIPISQEWEEGLVLWGELSHLSTRP